ncbi:class I SAM-dependent methyltransferase [Mesorhizobium kowhaii]|uniref:SAM-dependent methyltransferase n=1 Tax=Mesorhizobium kowhaii TaxID=1300272 RepID=A0A2W7BSM9_9HYPH|nr:methyltransferase domain-containing protein [Mesorhizobium kowhaii]PZV33845.1 SAM-dependent methyltransferase [Mesorhizobium kowhaii]
MQPIMDISLWLAHKRRALAHPVDGADFLMRRTAEDLADRLDAVERRFGKAAVLFCQTPAAAETLAESCKVAHIVRVEADTAFLTGGGVGLIAPLETVPFEPESLDLAVSLLSLQAMNDVPGMLIQIRRALRPDGLFLGAFAGAGTLFELRESLLAAETELYGGASPRVIPFTDVRDAGALLQRAGLALPVADVETVTVRYASLFGLMADLRAMGETSALTDRSRRPGARKLFARAAEIYAERFSDLDGRVRASFSIVWMSGWAPDASQQKPLKPGSAKVSLKTILEAPDGQ